jgi:hypothetical protein
LDKVKALAKEKLKEFEGSLDTVHQDSKGIDTIGSGMALRSPATKEAFDDLGYDTEKIRSGETSVPQQDLDSAMDNVLNKKYELLNRISLLSPPKQIL